MAAVWFAYLDTRERYDESDDPLFPLCVSCKEQLLNSCPRPSNTREERRLSTLRPTSSLLACDIVLVGSRVSLHLTCCQSRCFPPAVQKLVTFCFVETIATRPPICLHGESTAFEMFCAWANVVRPCWTDTYNAFLLSKAWQQLGAASAH